MKARKLTHTKLKAHRVYMGLTQTEIAERLGLSLRGYQMLEGQERAITRTLELLVGYVVGHYLHETLARPPTNQYINAKGK